MQFQIFAKEIFHGGGVVLLHVSMPVPLQDVWNHCFDGMVLMDCSGTILSINRSAMRLFEASLSSLIGCSIFEILPDADLRSSFDTKKNKTGVPLYLGTSKLVANLIFSHIPPDYALLTFKNITAQHQYQQQVFQLNNLKQMVDTLLDQLEEGVCVIDPQGKVLFYNKKMGEFDTLEPLTVRDKRIEEVWPIDEETSTLLSALQMETTLSQRQTHFATNGKAVTTLSKAFPLYIGDKKAGAMEIAKDITDQKQLTETILKLQHHQTITASPASPISKNQTRFQFEQIVYRSYTMGQTIEQARRVARSSSNVLIVGETGTGKELFAQSIHNASPRCSKPFIAQNCAALPETLLEGLLFGTTAGSFTGATDRPGLFEQAHGSTLLLDEINSMGTNLQAKLLRVLQERKVQRLGSSKVIDIDIRVIATINEDPQEAVSSGKLREDLYYRLAVVNLMIPSLRSRKDDIMVLVEHFIQKHMGALGVEVEGVDEKVKEIFFSYPWPGNVRQLEHIVEGALNLISEERFISVDHLPLALTCQHVLPNGRNLPSFELTRSSLNLTEQLERMERSLIEQALLEARGNITKASDQLGISRQNLNYKLKKLGITYQKEKAWL